MSKVMLHYELPKISPNYIGKHPKDMNRFEYNQMMKDAITGKLDDYPEQKKLFAEWLDEMLNNVGNGVQIEAEKPAEEFKPRMDLVTSLSLPFEQHCKMCGKLISSGEYCEECGKHLVGKSYV